MRRIGWGVGVTLVGLAGCGPGPTTWLPAVQAQEPGGDAPSDRAVPDPASVHPPQAIGDGGFWLERRRVVSRPTDPAFPDHPETVSVIPIIRPTDPVTGRAATGDIDASGCDLTKLRRTFRLEKREFLLGEPIIVEFRVENDGPGTWYETYGGDYRGTGRPDKYSLELRAAGGASVPDPYAVVTPGLSGGVNPRRAVTSGSEPGSGRGGRATKWLPVQRWCAVTQPGRYDLTCRRTRDNGIWIGPTTAAPKATADDAPGGERALSLELAARVQRQTEVRIDTRLLDEATFAITILPGTTGERDAMRVAYRAQIPGRGYHETMTDPGRASAVAAAIAYAMQDEWLPILREISTRDGDGTPDWRRALAMRGSDVALRWLTTEVGGEGALHALSWVRRDRLADVASFVLDRLDAAEERERRAASSAISCWAHEVGSDAKIPFPREVWELPPGAVSARWREWWRANHQAITAHYRVGTR